MITRAAKSVSVSPRSADPPQHEIPHPLSNDLVSPEELRPDAPPEPLTVKPSLDAVGEPTPVLTPAERKVGRTVLWFLLAATVIGLILAVVLFPRPELFVIGGILAVALAFFLMAPVILAETTRVAQDETVKEGLANHDESNADQPRR
jgi:hypothetical protein